MSTVDIAEGRRLLAAMAPGPYELRWPGEQGGAFVIFGRQGTPPFEDGWAIPLVASGVDSNMKAILWLLQNAEALLAGTPQARSAQREGASATEPDLDVERPDYDVEKLRAALMRIVALDYRGHPSTEQNIARDALGLGPGTIRGRLREAPDEVRIFVNRGGFLVERRRWTIEELRRLPVPSVPKDHDFYRVVPGANDELVEVGINVFDGLRLFTFPRSVR